MFHNREKGKPSVLKHLLTKLDISGFCSAMFYECGQNQCFQSGSENIINMILSTVGVGADEGAKAKHWCLQIFTSSASFSSGHCDIPQHFKELLLTVDLKVMSRSMFYVSCTSRCKRCTVPVLLESSLKLHV